MIANRTNDGSAPPQFHTPPNSDPYEWQTTAGCPAGGGAFKHWPNVKPFGIESSSQFRADPPPSLTSTAYARDFKEVQAVGEINSTQRPQDRADVARLYAAQPPHYGWNSVLRQIASTRDDDISVTARTAAVMNMSLSDAHITVFESKYFYRHVASRDRDPARRRRWQLAHSTWSVHSLHCHALLPRLSLGAWCGRRRGS